MFYRNGEYAYLDGSLFSLEGLQSLYVSRTKQGIVLLYMNGHKVEIKYGNVTTTMKAWELLKSSVGDVLTKKDYIQISNVMIVRCAAIQHMEFDEIDDRFAVLYKTGECFVFDFDSAFISAEVYRIILKRYFGVDEKLEAFSVDERHRADFWTDVTAEITGRTEGEEIPNKGFWAQIDSAVMNVKKNR